ncbi:EmrB/QacA subfamily drug resistance transporter [Aeromonas sp. BIGb0405]|uniref:MFS transporter n=1 Tax=Aeromonas sp. BIGb0405 TaxID=2940592 RepID=UPI0021684AEE|nr:MFS transporter [Aeromonas sp. BIGb0405]MCS3456108.1 EmrB/QacA subfamily drug resistance transporter [Aeromonas sp. BIGb0405]
MTLSPRRQGSFALAAVCLSALMLGLEISSVPPILSTIEQVMGASFRQLQWIMAAYTIAMTTILMGVGTLADRYGRKRIFTIGILAFGVTSLICGLADSAAVLIVARFLQGLSAAMMLICQIAILSNQFRDGRERGAAFAWWGMVFGAGLGFGPIVGGAILALASWQWVFLIHAVLAVMTLLLSQIGVQESRDPHATHLDIKGIATLSVAVFCLVLFVTQGPVLGFGSAAAMSIIGMFMLSFASFVVAERTSRRPMLEFSMFRVRNFSGALLGSMGQNFSFWPFIIYLPIYFHVALGYDNVQTGLALLAYTLPTLFIPPLAERLAMRYQAGIVIPVGLSIIGMGFVLMRAGSQSAQPGWLLLPGAVLAGVGLGLTNTTTTNTITAAVSAERVGMASGADTSARMISLAFNIAVMGFILVEGIMAYLRNKLGIVEGASLRLFAEKIAAGDITVLEQHSALLPHIAIPAEAVNEALVAGFGWVMVYGAASAFLLAAISFFIFSPGRSVQRNPEMPQNT